jgi:hypothetical protein
MLSRWKLMAGVLGVSIGGLAAAASQCPKFDRSKGRSDDARLAKAEPKLPPAGAPSAPPAPPKLELPAVPAPPQLTPGGVTPPAPTPAPSVLLPDPTPASPKVPEVPAPPTNVFPTTAKPEMPAPVIPTAAATPAKPEPKPAEPMLPPVDLGPKPTTTADPLVVPNLTPPAKPPASPVGAVKPPKPAVNVPPSGVSVGSEPVNGVIPQFASTPPVGVTPPPGKPVTTAPVASPLVGSEPPPLPGAPEPSPPAHAEPLGVPKGPTAPAAIQAGQTPFRILLRVGEGEPTFEVKNGDNLVLKVACEKVDIKSPEKGAGMSEVVARGKVRFAGFGAEGTCDELKFFAGTGEVSMSGTVKVQVKDKLGRVESELTTGSMKYRIDVSSVGGPIKP